MWKFIKYTGLILLLAIAIPRLTSWLPFTLPFAQPEQDTCTFGPVTNVEYRAMLSKARALQRWRWFGSDAPDELAKQLLEISTGSSLSPYRKIAAMHAVLRALGADFRNNGAFSNGMFERTFSKGGTIQYNYALSVPRIGILALPGNAWFIGSLKGPPHPIEAGSRTRHQGEVYFITHFPNPIDQIPDVLQRGEVVCPPVPPRELEAFFADAFPAPRN